MKLIIESFRKFLTEENFIGDLPLDYDEEDNVILYHISATEGINEFDPSYAAKNLQNYTQQEYRSWDRPRVFFFTRLGQEDTGVGRISGIPYSVKISANQLYPIMDDPAGLSSKIEQQNWMIENSEKDMNKPRSVLLVRNTISGISVPKLQIQMVLPTQKKSLLVKCC